MLVITLARVFRELASLSNGQCFYTGSKLHTHVAHCPDEWAALALLQLHMRRPLPTKNASTSLGNRQWAIWRPVTHCLLPSDANSQFSFAAEEGFRRCNVEFAISNNLIRKQLLILVLQGMHWSCRVAFVKRMNLQVNLVFSVRADLWWIRGHQVKKARALQ